MINQDKVQLTINVINNDENNVINNDENNLINNDENNLINNHENNLINNHENNLINNHENNLINNDENNLINNHENNLINNHEINLICNCCSRPILLKDFDEIIDLNYKDAPKFFKIFLKNDWINGYKLLNKKVKIALSSLPDNFLCSFGDERSLDILNTEGKLPFDKLPRRIAFQKWKFYLDKGQERCIATCEKMIKKIIISKNKELNLTNTDKYRFSEELNNLKIELEELDKRKIQQSNLNSNLNTLREECRLDEESHEDLYEHENMHTDSREDSYEHMHEDSHNNGQEHNI
jgi:hypothetical protein